MTGEQFHDVLTLLPEDLVARADEYRSRKPNIIPWKRYAAIAACFAVLLSTAIFVYPPRKNAAPTEMATAFHAMQDTEAAAAETPRMEAAKGTPETSGSEATADSAVSFTCVETPDNLHTTACYAHGPSATAIVSREELDAYLSKWDRLYLLDTLRDACLIYDADWFASHNLLLIPVDHASACTVMDITIADGSCMITIGLNSSQTDSLTNYHIMLPVEKGSVTDTQNITVIYKSDTTG